jgi:hypothetical protein
MWQKTPLGKNTYNNYGCVANNMLVMAGGAGVTANKMIAFTPDSLFNATSPYVTVGNLSTNDTTLGIACVPLYY